MKKLGLMAAGLMLGMGLIAYAATSGDEAKQNAKASCDPAACEKAGCDPSACDPAACDTSACVAVCAPSCAPSNK